MTKIKKSPNHTSNSRSPFGQTIDWALKNFRKPDRLGTKSPLASPFLLGTYLDSNNASAQVRGRALQEFLKQAMAQLTGPKAERYRAIITRTYFNGQTIAQAADEVGLGRTQFKADRKQAVRALEEAVVQMLTPAIQLETPQMVPALLVGREDQITHCHQALANGQVVAIGGPGGLGKTTLGSALANAWQDGPVFWYTIRPGLNDHPSSLLHALGYFFHRHRASTLWLELMAQTESVSLDHALDLIRYSIRQLGQKELTPLFCFDEVDLLNPSESGEQSDIVQLLQNLFGETPMLLIGQQPTLNAHYYCPLDELSFSETSQMLVEGQLRLSPSEQRKIHQFTNGNPRLIDLCIALFESDESLTLLFDRLPTIPPLEFLFTRILQRLSDDERGILLDLSVFRSPVPFEPWSGDGIGLALQNLHRRRLLQFDDAGNVSLLTAYVQVLVQNMAQGNLALLHQKAASILLDWGQYTMAIYHLARTMEPEQAVWLWRDFQQQEIDQGQAGAALTILRNLVEQPLQTEARDQALLFCAKLERLLGNSKQAVEDIRHITERTPLLGIERDVLSGELANDANEFEQAGRYFRRAITVAESFVDLRLVQSHKGLGWMYKREKNLDSAWQEALLARFEVENLQGFIQELRCHYAEAERHYRAALSLAEEVAHVEGKAKTSLNLAGLLARQGTFESAKACQQDAERNYKKIGKTIAIASAITSRGFICNLAGSYQDAVEAYKESRDLLTQFKVELPSWSIAVINQGLAEGYLGLGNLDAADDCLEHVLATEDPTALPDSYRTRGEILLQRKKLGDAAHWIAASLDHLAQLESPDAYLEGYAWRALALVHIARKDRVRAEQAKAQAIELFEEINLPFEVQKTVSMFSYRTAEA
ncbi:hypothetical protein KFU94_44685 [Chloroflexi bacterium TSY]|nr:hypothetical protein [Chloroflexi bacterium TSY]